MYPGSTVHRMRLQPEPFESIRNGQKSIEMRLNDGKRRKLRVGDVIIFSCTDQREETIPVRVLALHSCASFTDLYALFRPADLGYSPDETASPLDMRAYYPEDEERAYGVLGIEFLKIDPQNGWLLMDRQVSRETVIPAACQEVMPDFALDVSLGKDESGEDIVCDFNRIGCGWIMGCAGSGKTAFCRNILDGIAVRYGSAFDFCVYDGAGDGWDLLADGDKYRGADAGLEPGLYISSDPSDILRRMKAELRRREQLLEAITSPRPSARWVSWKTLLWKRVFYFFDTYDPRRLSDRDRETFRTMTAVLRRFGERYGMHMIAAVTSPSDAEAEDWVHAESQLRVLLRTPRPYRSPGYDPWPASARQEAPLLRPGEFLYFWYPNEIYIGRGTFAPVTDGTAR